jgi:hypothetical protein
MDGKEIFDEIMKSPRLKELLGVPEEKDLQESYEASSPHNEVTIIRNIIEGQVRHTSEDNIFKSIKKLYDL